VLREALADVDFAGDAVDRALLLHTAALLKAAAGTDAHGT
jgi:hypothetical protein